MNAKTLAQSLPLDLLDYRLIDKCYYNELKEFLYTFPNLYTREVKYLYSKI